MTNSSLSSPWVSPAMPSLPSPQDFRAYLWNFNIAQRAPIGIAKEGAAAYGGEGRPGAQFVEIGVIALPSLLNKCTVIQYFEDRYRQMYSV